MYQILCTIAAIIKKEYSEIVKILYKSEIIFGVRGTFAYTKLTRKMH